MAAESTTLDPTLDEREHVLRMLREEAPGLRARDCPAEPVRFDGPR
jgi:hypothetical protein